MLMEKWMSQIMWHISHTCRKLRKELNQNDWLTQANEEQTIPNSKSWHLQYPEHLRQGGTLVKVAVLHPLKCQIIWETQDYRTYSQWTTTALKMTTTGSSEMLVTIYQPTWCWTGHDPFPTHTQFEPRRNGEAVRRSWLYCCVRKLPKVVVGLSKLLWRDSITKLANNNNI
jgi:hypothetical protein